MKPIKFKILNFALIVFFIFIGCKAEVLNAQVTKVKYMTKYNNNTTHFDCFLVIVEGKTNLPIHRLQFNAQISLIVPYGSLVTLTERYMPLRSNQAYTGTEVCQWLIASLVYGPKVQPQNDFYSIIPSLSPSSFYNDLAPGDTIKLFSIKVLPIPICKQEVRLFENDTDPGPSASGMGGGDFSQLFTMGSVENLHAGNITTQENQVSIENNQLVSHFEGTYFEWYDCTTKSIIASGTEQVFLPNQSGQYYCIAYDEFCNARSECIDFILGSVLNSSKEEIKIYPNPVSQLLSLETKSTIKEVKLYQMSGILIKHILGNTQNIDFSELNCGLYILEVNTNNTLSRFKIYKH